MSFKFTIQYQLGQRTGTKEVIAESQEQAIFKLWDEISQTLGYIAYNAYKSASIINVKM